MCLAIPAQVVELVPGEESRALVDILGVRRRIDTGLLTDDPPRAGDWVLVHVGFAMSKLSAEQAEDQIQTLRLLGEDAAAKEELASGGAPGEKDTT